jgi:hypothetical protein
VVAKRIIPVYAEGLTLVIKNNASHFTDWPVLTHSTLKKSYGVKNYLKSSLSCVLN